VAKSVVEVAPCSVELVRAILEEHSNVAHAGFRILLAVDESDGSIAAAEHVAQTTWPNGTNVNVISVVNPVVYSLEEIGLYTGTGTKRAHQAINDAVQSLKGNDLEISAAVVAGRITKEIIRQAKLWRADLIVVGSNKRRGLKGMISRSTSESVASRADRSVRIISSESQSANSKEVNWPFKGSITYELGRGIDWNKAA
jgi:nucleotide-binding universal stress UspA family protein